MLKFIKVRKTIINATDIESVHPGTYRDHNGLQQHRIIVTLKNGNRHTFGVDSQLKIQGMINEVFDQILSLDDNN